MSTYTFPTNEKLAFLRDEEDWRPWLNMIQGRASSLEIWNKINPDHPSTLMEQPTDPQKPDPKDYEAKAGIEEPTLMSHLSKEGLKSYKEDKQDYKDSIDDWKIRYQHYKEERQKVIQMTTLIQTSVASHLQEASCLAGLTLSEWISNLKNSVGADDDTERERVRAWYRTTLRPMRNLNNWPSWVNEYDRASTSAVLWGVSDVANMISITTDFMAAIPRSEQGWCDSFSHHRKSPDMTIKKMLHSFREHMNRVHPVKSGRNRPAAFATAEDDSYVADGATDTTVQGSKRDASSAPDGAPSAKRSKRKPTGKRPTNASSTNKELERPALSNDVRKCPLCDSDKHGLDRCWHVHKDLAPSWWRSDTLTQTLMERLQKADPTFRKLVQEAQDKRANL